MCFLRATGQVQRTKHVSSSFCCNDSCLCPVDVGLATNCLNKAQQDDSQLFIHNRTASKAEPLLKKGAVWAESPAGIAKQCSVTFSCVFSDKALQEVFADYLSGQPKAGSLYVDCSTVYPETIRELDAQAKAGGD